MQQTENMGGDLTAIMDSVCSDTLNVVVRDGRVYNSDGKFAIVLSPGYGAGWSTWGADVYDPLAVVLLLLGNNNIVDYNFVVDRYYPDREYRCSQGFDQAEVQWLSPGTQFKIDEYDGHESIKFRSDDSIWQS
jgi:hypothetical protein